MIKTKRKLAAAFEPETRFEVRPQPALPFRAIMDSELEQLTQRLLKEALAEADPGLNPSLRRAAADALALVWQLPFPQLLLPELFAERARAARDRSRHQELVYARTRRLYDQAA